MKQLEALDRLCNMAIGDAPRDIACAKTDYWTVRDGLGARFDKICSPIHAIKFEVWKSISGPWYCKISADEMNPDVTFQATAETAQKAVELAVKYYEAGME